MTIDVLEIANQIKLMSIDEKEELSKILANSDEGVVEVGDEGWILTANGDIVQGFAYTNHLSQGNFRKTKEETQALKLYRKITTKVLNVIHEENEGWLWKPGMPADCIYADENGLAFAEVEGYRQIVVGNDIPVAIKPGKGNAVLSRIDHDEYLKAIKYAARGLKGTW